MSRKDGLLEDVDEESRAIPIGLITAVLVLELAALGCALLIRFGVF